MHFIGRFPSEYMIVLFVYKIVVFSMFNIFAQYWANIDLHTFI